MIASINNAGLCCNKAVTLSAQKSLRSNPFVLRHTTGAGNRMAKASFSRGLSPLAMASDEYTSPDQPARFAEHKRTNNVRAMDIDQVYDPSPVKGKRVVVTGANRGIGLSLCIELQAVGARVIAVCRKSSKELDALGVEQIIEGIDQTITPTMQKLVDELAEPVDVLVNNAGYFYEPLETIESLNFEEQIKQIDICAVGPLRVTGALFNAGLLKSGSKVAMITSQGGSITWRDVQNPTGHDYGHHMSKAAANMAGKLVSQELKGSGITVTMLHPGFNKTDMTAKYADIWEVEGAVNPCTGAKRVVQEIGKMRLEDTGKFINCEDGLLIPW